MEPRAICIKSYSPCLHGTWRFDLNFHRLGQFHFYGSAGCSLHDLSIVLALLTTCIFPWEMFHASGISNFQGCPRLLWLPFHSSMPTSEELPSVLTLLSIVCLHQAILLLILLHSNYHFLNSIDLFINHIFRSPNFT